MYIIKSRKMENSRHLVIGMPVSRQFGSKSWWPVAVVVPQTRAAVPVIGCCWMLRNMGRPQIPIVAQWPRFRRDVETVLTSHIVIAWIGAPGREIGHFRSHQRRCVERLVGVRPSKTVGPSVVLVSSVHVLVNWIGPSSYLKDIVLANWLTLAVVVDICVVRLSNQSNWRAIAFHGARPLLISDNFIRSNVSHWSERSSNIALILVVTIDWSIFTRPSGQIFLPADIAQINRIWAIHNKKASDLLNSMIEV